MKNGIPILGIKPTVLTPVQEAQELLDDATKVIAGDIGRAIASLPVLVGRGTAPAPDNCRAFAERIVQRFANATLSAIEGERAIAELAELKATVPADVRRLVIAARVVAFEDSSPEAKAELDAASEAFADRVAWKDEPASKGAK